MHTDPNIPNNTPNDGTDKEPDADGAKTGFLMIRARRGDEVEVGDALIGINEVSQGYVTMAIKAPRSTKVRRKMR